MSMASDRAGPFSVAVMVKLVSLPDSSKLPGGDTFRVMSVGAASVTVTSTAPVTRS